MGWKYIGQFIVGVITLVLGAFFGSEFERQRSEDEGNMRYLDLREVRSSGLLNDAQSSGLDIEITRGGEPIEDISQVSIELYNFSDRDFEDVMVYVTLEHQRSENAVETFYQHAVGARGVSESVTSVPTLPVTDRPGAVRYGYRVSTMNRLGTDEVFSVSFIVNGDVAPAATVYVDEVGLDTRPFSSRRLYERTWGETLLIFGVYIGSLVVYVGVIAFGMVRRRNLARAKRKRIAAAIAGYLERPGTSSVITNARDLTSIASHIEEVQVRDDWENAGRFLRPVLAKLDLIQAPTDS